MRRRRARSALRHALLLGAAACATGSPAGDSLPAPSPTVGDAFFVAGYHAYWTGESWRDYPWDALHQLYFFEIEIGSDGAVADGHGWPHAWSALLARAREAGVSVVPTISMHDAAAFQQLFTQPERVQRLVDDLIALLTRMPDLGGLHLDFEVFQPVELAARDGYTAFVARLASSMDALDPSLSVSVFAMAFDDDEVYNERALAELADFLVVQGYDFHHATGTRAGPLAALHGWGRLNWASVVDRFVALGVPPRKLVMSVPMYGYEWPVAGPEAGAPTRGPGVILPLAPAPDIVPELPRARARVAEHGVQRDAESGAPFYTFRSDSGWHQGWLEDAESLRAKYRFVRERGLGGVAVFPLAYGDEAMWRALRSELNRPRGGTPRARSR
ncbi:MAG TPA: glycosyl hydrolase family 18 protein [Longimicrobiales bacterium]|nr:glycosyl hydrolase family 18 protein [Longimicrobiales bacterium]